MGISLAGLIQGLTTDASGALQGIQDKKTLEQQARQQLLAESLQHAQLANIGSEIQRRADQTRIDEEKARSPKVPPRLQDPVTGIIWERNPDTGEWEQGKMQPPTPTPQTPTPPPGQQPTPPKPSVPAKLHVKPPRPLVGYTPQGGMQLVDPNTHQVTDVGGVGRPATAQQLTAGAQAPIADNAVTHMERVANADEDAFRTAVAFIRAKRHGTLGDLLSESRGALSDANAQAIVEDYYNYMLNISPTYGGTRPTKVLMDLETEAGVPPVGSDKSTWPRIFQRFHDQVRVLRARAGRAAGPETDHPPARLQ